MQQSNWEAVIALEQRCAALGQLVNARMAELAAILSGIAMFSDRAAAVAEGEVTQETRALLQSLGTKLSQAIAHILEEKENNQEDWDSSAHIHLLTQLKRRADALGL